jgi:hypothetical protein
MQSFLFLTRLPFHVYRFGADQQKWSSIRGALRKGLVEDGDVCIVVERMRS